MNILSKFLLLYCTLAALLIVVGLFIFPGGNLVTYLLLVPLPTYFVLFPLKDLFAKNTDLGLSFAKARFFLVLFLVLIIAGVYKLSTAKPSTAVSPLKPAVWSTPAPTPQQAGLLKINLSADKKFVNIYEKMATDSAVIGKAYDGDVFEYVNQTERWYEINFENNQKGFVEQ